MISEDALAEDIQARLTRALRFDGDGLVAAVVIQHDTGEVLMLGWMTAETLAETIETGRTVFYSRSRQQRWAKGDTSGNRQDVVRIDADCDGDALLVQVDQGPTGVACHTGRRSCFHRPLETLLEASESAQNGPASAESEL